VPDRGLCSDMPETAHFPKKTLEKRDISRRKQAATKP
jgi:hypothetical protein